MADSWEDHEFESDEENAKDDWDKDSEKESPKAVTKEAAKENATKDEDLLSGSATPCEAGLRDSIDTFEPTNWEEMMKFKELLRFKITQFDKSQYYAGFLEEMVKTLCKDVDLDSLKKISDTLTAVSNEKAKLSKNAKAKKKSKKANLVTGKDVDLFEQYRVEDTAFDDYDDYM